MMTSGDKADPSVRATPVGVGQLPEKARAAVAEIKAGNAAMRIEGTIAEAEAEATEKQAELLNQVAEEVIEELRERKEEAGQACGC
jgi:hypothetical protein